MPVIYNYKMMKSALESAKFKLKAVFSLFQLEFKNVFIFILKQIRLGRVGAFAISAACAILYCRNMYFYSWSACCFISEYMYVPRRAGDIFTRALSALNILFR